jgi:hypothetical protein
MKQRFHLHFYYLFQPLKCCAHDPRKRWWQLFAFRTYTRTNGEQPEKCHWVYTPWGGFIIELE